MKNKNALLSFIAYAASYLLLFSLHLTGSPYAFIFYLVVLAGIFFAYMSNKKKESSWMGNLLLIIGILSLLYPSALAMPLAFILDGISR